MNWLLVREKQIGAPDADSYFVNILPLEIQILKRQKEMGLDVDSKLKKLEAVLKARDASFAPKGLRPVK